MNPGREDHPPDSNLQSPNSVSPQAKSWTTFLSCLLFLWLLLLAGRCESLPPPAAQSAAEHRRVELPGTVRCQGNRPAEPVHQQCVTKPTTPTSFSIRP